MKEPISLTNSLLGPLALVILVFLAFGSGLRGDFIGDDWATLYYNRDNLGLDRIPVFFTGGVWEFTSHKLEGQNMYRPLWLAWNSLVYQVAGMESAKWHLAGLLLHVVNVLLLYRISGMLLDGDNLLLRFFSVALFAIHPALAESVAWISGSTDPLMMVFGLAALHQHLALREQGRRRHLLATLLLYTVALFVKETAIVLPLLFLLMDREWRCGEKKASLNEYAGLVLVTMGYLVVRFNALDGLGGGQSLVLGTEQLIRYVAYLLLFLRYLLLPWPHPFYHLHVELGLEDWIGIVLVALILAGLIYAAIRRRRLRVVLAWMLFPLLPPAMLAFHEHGYFALRTLYLPAIGLTLLVLIVGESISEARKKAVLGLLVLAYLPLSIIATGHWNDEESHNRRVLNSMPGDIRAHRNLAQYLQKEKRFEDAILVYRQAMALPEPDDKKIPIAVSYGRLLNRRGMADEAIGLYQWLASQPGVEREGLIPLARLYLQSRDVQRAMLVYERLLRYEPNHAAALYWSGLRALQSGEQELAKYRFERLLAQPRTRVERRYRADASRRLRSLTEQ